MLKIIAILLSAALLPQSAVGALDKGELYEFWSGEINLAEDKIVPAGHTLTIAPGTRVVTNGNRIISYGTLNIMGKEENKVGFLYSLPRETGTIEVVSLKPYQVDTAILEQEFNTFKVQYAILWSLLFASTFLMLEAR
ncbi:hypothetical protein ACFL4J_01455 [Candidatus Margulisiibacteriota bacterium]